MRATYSREIARLAVQTFPQNQKGRRRPGVYSSDKAIVVLSLSYEDNKKGDHRGQ